MEIKAKEIKFVDLASLIPNPKNPNEHSTEQIERLAQIIKYQGFRNPIVVSNRTGFVVAGHGRIAAARLLGLKQVPVIHQDFESEAQEYAHLVADNAIAEWAELKIPEIKLQALELPELKIEMMGIKKFDTEEKEIKNTSKELGQGEFSNFDHQCPKCGFFFNDEA